MGRYARARAQRLPVVVCHGLYTTRAPGGHSSILDRPGLYAPSVPPQNHGCFTRANGLVVVVVVVGIIGPPLPCPVALVVYGPGVGPLFGVAGQPWPVAGPGLALAVAGPGLAGIPGAWLANANNGPYGLTGVWFAGWPNRQTPKPRPRLQWGA